MKYFKQLDSLSTYLGDIIVFFLIIPFQSLHKQYVGLNGIDWIESLLSWIDLKVMNVYDLIWWIEMDNDNLIDFVGLLNCVGLLNW